MHNESYDKTCPLCSKEAEWKLSGTGKNYVLRCEEHGWVRIIRNPIFGPPKKRYNLLQRIIKSIFDI